VVGQNSRNTKRGAAEDVPVKKFRPARDDATTGLSGKGENLRFNVGMRRRQGGVAGQTNKSKRTGMAQPTRDKEVSGNKRISLKFLQKGLSRVQKQGCQFKKKNTNLLPMFVGS